MRSIACSALQKQAQETLQELHKKAANLQAQKDPEELSAANRKS